MAGKSKQVGNGEKFVALVQKNAKIIVGTFVAVFLSLYLYPALPKQDMLRALEIVSQHGIQQKPAHNIALGWNTNLDLSIDAVDFMKQMGIKSSLPVEDHSTISTLDELNAETSAAERHVKNKELFNKMLEVADQMISKKYTIGGNAALMASQFVNEGHNVYLGGPTGPILTSLLHSGITISPLSSKENDEVHIILEYSKGSQWGDQVASRGNRFILTRDNSNSNLFGLEELQSHLQEKEIIPNLFVASGIHLLEGNQLEERKKQLGNLVQFFREVNKTIPIHLEFASIGDQAFLKEAILTLLPEIDSIGFNEQELAAIFTALGGEYNETIKREDITSQIPVPSTVAYAIRYIFQQFSTSQQRQLSRMHFHSFSYHIVAELVTPKATIWKNAKAAVAHGAVAATTTACNKTVQEIEEKDIEFLVPSSFFAQIDIGMKPMELSSVNPVAEWSISLFEVEEKSSLEIEFSLAGIPVCANPQHTVGLGDVISAAGLAYSL